MENNKYVLGNLNKIREMVESELKSPFEMWEFGEGYYDGIVGRLNERPLGDDFLRDYVTRLK